MGQYKVPQDVEAEDKIIGSLTIKQFIYATIGVVWGLLTLSILRRVPLLFVLIGVPPTLLFLLLGLYQPKGQPFEALFLAIVSFLTKPRRRIWQKDPVEQVFRIEPPKPKPEQAPRDQREVMGQLEKLAQIVDTRGWSAKRPELQEPQAEAVLSMEERLAAPVIAVAPAGEEAAAEPEVGIKDDILDFQNNPSVENLNALIEDVTKHIREDAVSKMRGRQAASTSEMTAQPPPAILKLATENDDLTVSQIAAQAHKAAPLAEGQSVNLRNAGTNR